MTPRDLARGLPYMCCGVGEEASYKARGRLVSMTKTVKGWGCLPLHACMHKDGVATKSSRVTVYLTAAS